MRSAFSLVSAGITLMLLSGCQMQGRSQKPAIFSAPTALSCQAMWGCEIARIDNLNLLDEAYSPGQGTATSTSASSGAEQLPTFSKVTLAAGKHDTAIKFYPISQQQAEYFSFIHNYAAKSDYQLVIYRQRSEHEQSLSMAALPGMLCIDLLRNKQPIRRFCRPMQSQSTSNEFVEQSLTRK